MPEQIYKFDPGSIRFTSDTHFGHENIIRFCNRPFRNAEEMNAELIRRWRETVPEDGIIFHLGDFAHGGSRLWNDILSALPGRKYLILGNHDMKSLRQGYMGRFEHVAQQMTIRVDPIDATPIKEAIAGRVSLLTGNTRYVYIGSRPLDDFRYVPIGKGAGICMKDVEIAIEIL